MKHRFSVALLSVAVLSGAWLAIARRPFESPESQARQAAATPAGFVYVPGGECWIGSQDDDADDDSRPRRRVYVPSFYIGRCEVTQAEWKKFKPSYDVPKGYERHPITHVLREEAEAYCRSVGGRLPTDREWEKAARGPNGLRFPWGDTFAPERCNLKRSGPAKKLGASCNVLVARRGMKPVDAYPEGASPYGALNMAGNAWEWVSDAYGGNRDQGIIRGGAVGYGERDARTYHRAVEGAAAT